MMVKITEAPNYLEKKAIIQRLVHSVALEIVNMPVKER